MFRKVKCIGLAIVLAAGIVLSVSSEASAAAGDDPQDIVVAVPSPIAVGTGATWVDLNSVGEVLICKTDGQDCLIEIWCRKRNITDGICARYHISPIRRKSPLRPVSVPLGHER